MSELKPCPALEIELKHGLSFLIDRFDYDIVKNHTWHAKKRRDNKGWYVKNSKGQNLARLLMNPPDNLIVDHIDGNGLNNTRGNLRIGTQSQNCVNRKITPGQFMRGTRMKGKKWQAYIKYKGLWKNLGTYNSEVAAHNVYLEAALKLHGDWMPVQPLEENNA